MLESAVATLEASWENSWLWGVPLVVATVVFHVLCLGLIDRGVTMVLDSTALGRPSLLRFVLVMGSVAFLATFLHAAEATFWGLAYLVLGALPSVPSAMLYSLNALTSFGHDNLYLLGHWQLLGAIEALNGIMLFGMTTAFLFAIMQRVWFLGHR
ncbi:hypothetical protein [Kaistia algarum]|uniref:hypothetical protein n=1 Tax=Kaistia algarum TaxID=2083279 RepID=UPI001A9C8455|nr:hypothetical protein [Kaistia algarum]MCX5514435.1 hypothetical protein [Kaistia algarum]